MQSILFDTSKGNAAGANSENLDTQKGRLPIYIKTTTKAAEYAAGYFRTHSPTAILHHLETLVKINHAPFSVKQQVNDHLIES
ncbi:MAG: hypothetical protein AAGI09_08740 [Pseudomonadota bacterium]